MTIIEIKIEEEVGKTKLDEIVDDISELIEHNIVTVYLTNSRLKLIPLNNND